MDFNEIIKFLQQQLAENQFFQGAALAGLITTVAYQLLGYAKSIPGFIYRRVLRLIRFQVVIDQTDELYPIFNKWLYENYQRSFRYVEAKYAHNAESAKNASDGKYRSTSAIIKDETGNLLAINKRRGRVKRPGFNARWKLNQIIGFHHPNSKMRRLITLLNNNIQLVQYQGTFFLFNKNIPIWITKDREKLEGGTDAWNAYRNSFVISAFFSKKTILKMLKDIVEEYKEETKKEKKVIVYVNSSNYNGLQRYKEYVPTSLDNIICNDTDKEDLIADLDNFLSKREWYLERGITYKRNYLLYGEPGNGKTSLITAIAHKYDRPLCYLDLNSVTSDSSLRDFFSELPDNAILVVEDLHAIFDKEKPIKEDLKVSHSTLLNLLSGVLEKEGVITFFTTNDVSKLSDALSRPGRIDYRLEVKLPNKQSAEKYVQLFFNDPSLVIEQYKEGKSYATLQNICLLHQNDSSKALKVILDE
jgi:AAA+ superfamily predicted ATPase